MEKRLPLPAGTVLQGRYRIARQLGHGGFGAVYEAIDDDLNLAFALKETFYAESDELRQAFKREARLLARLSHDAFPRVTHYFTEGDGCFLVMELVPGDDLDKLLARRAAPFGQEQVLSWADQILDALEDLHAAGIIHRDIKPSNLKLTPKGRIKLLDFGIAKGAVEGETTFLTTVGSLAAATLQYAPLEQVLKSSQQYQIMLSVVSPDKVSEIMQCSTNAASDLFALAATLYHLLTKQLPADAPTRALALWSGQPDRLSAARELNTQVKPEVSAILQKALSLDRINRYRTAAEMRQALKDAVKPSSAPPEPIFLPATLVNVVKSDEIETQAARHPVQPTSPSPQLTHAPPASPVTQRRNWIPVFVIIGLLALLPVGLIAYFISKSVGRTPTWLIPAGAKYTLAATLSGHTRDVFSVTFSPDGKTIASASDDKTIKLWNAANGTLKKTLTGHSDFVRAVAFSPDGKTLASGSVDKTIKLWDAVSGAEKQTINAHDSCVVSVAFSPDGKTLASVSWDKTVKLWDVTSGVPRQVLSGHTDWVVSVTFSPDGKMIASGSYDGTIKLWDAASGALRQTLTVNDGVIWSVAYSPDGKTIANGSVTINLWELATGSPKPRELKDSARSVIFSPDGKTIASGGEDKTIKIWDAESGNLRQTLAGHSSPVFSVAFSPDGKSIISGSEDSTVKIWRAE